jgi:hypothetical protein
LELGGYADWRLPSRMELLSIVDYGRYTPSINPVFSCSSGYFWSGSTGAWASGYAWRVVFGDGGSVYDSKYYACHVRCVRGGHGTGSFGSFISGPLNILLHVF